MIPASAWTDAGSPWRTTEECARYLRLFTKDGHVDREAASEFLRKAKARSCRRGRSVLFHRQDVEAALTQDVRRSA